MVDRSDADQAPPRGPGDRRQEDRRRGDRRREDRRAPVPYWRRPWAFAAYGVAATLVLVAVLSLAGGEEEGEGLRTVTSTPLPGVEPNAPAAAAAPPRDAYSVGDFERLLAEGQNAVGQRVRTILFCEPTGVVALRAGESVMPSIAALADVSGRVPAAECKWSADTSAPDILLLVPPELAQRFAAAPQVVQGFIRRRRVAAEVEWLGRPESLALRNAAVLREME